MTFHTAFDRIHSDEPGVFLQDSHFRSSEYRAWLALPTVNPPSWPEFRDALLAKVKPKAKPLGGHAVQPLNLPGSFNTPLKGSN